MNPTILRDFIRVPYMNPTILGDIGLGFLFQVPTLIVIRAAAVTAAIACEGLEPMLLIRAMIFSEHGFTVNPIKLETGLRPNRAGISYTLLLRIEAIGFQTFGLLLYRVEALGFEVEGFGFMV